MLGDIAIARPQITDQLVLATAHVQGQKAVMIIIILAVKKSLFLMPRHGVIRGIKVQVNSSGGWERNR